MLTGVQLTNRDRYPVVRASVGEHLSNVKARSTYDFDFESAEDDIPYFTDEPVVSEYAGDGTNEALRFRLPLGQFASIKQVGARIYHITVATQLEYLNLKDAYARSQEVADSIASAPGWRRTGRETPSLGELRDCYAGESPGRRTHAGMWKAGGVKLSVTIKRAKKADTVYPHGYPERLKPEEDLFLIDVNISNYDLEERYMENVWARRRAAGDELASLPIEVWLADSTQQQE